MGYQEERDEEPCGDQVDDRDENEEEWSFCQNFCASNRGRSELSTSGASHSNFWLVSFAAAVMGFAILGRRMYKMKKKTMGLEIKVFVDDKKISQVMSRAARLNEAFLIVIRVPVIRPSLQAVGSTNTWPVTSLR
ncbi:hypothetical protein CASFOL_038489 [Castilleja foliolosa]|uniref:DUF6821 domain-containing protein n=1 Tax=Castilleja foliolosa TaxID=1961234 RepID=A0ABD3BLT7_9LAMI